MESIFSRDKHTPIRATIADYISLLCYEKNERLAAHKAIKQVYDLRSEIVHSGKTKISNDFVKQAETIAARALLQSLRLFRSLENTGQSENEFFQRLLEMKLS